MNPLLTFGALYCVATCLLSAQSTRISCWLFRPEFHLTKTDKALELIPALYIRTNAIISVLWAVLPIAQIATADVFDRSWCMPHVETVPSFLCSRVELDLLIAHHDNCC